MLRKAVINGGMMVLGLMVALLAIEGALRVNTWAENQGSPQESLGPLPPPGWEHHPALRLRIEPDAPGHDGRGYRNEQALATADIVALGDSQTYGTGVDRQEAWPHQLTEISGLTVYNMGMGSSGPAHYFYRYAHEAAEIEAPIIVVGLYLGNDLVDAYDMVYEFDAADYHPFKTPDTDPATGLIDLQVIKDLWAGQYDSQQEYYRQVETAYADQAPALLRFVQRNTKLYWWLANRGVLRPETYPDVDLQELASQEWARNNPGDALVVEYASGSTVLRTSLRAASTDLADPVVLEGLRLTQAFLLEIQAQASARGQQLVVMLIPTKELIYGLALGPETTSDPVLVQLVSNETEALDRLDQFCLDNDLHCLNLVGMLIEAVINGTAVYPSEIDGHPTPAGYTVIAQALLADLQRLSCRPTDPSLPAALPC